MAAVKTDLSDEIVALLLDRGDALNARAIVARLELQPTDYLLQQVRHACRTLCKTGELQEDRTVLYHNTGTHWIHTFHAACRYVGRQRVTTGGDARRAAIKQYAPRLTHTTRVDPDVFFAQLDLLWAEILDLRAQLAEARAASDPIADDVDNPRCDYCGLLLGECDYMGLMHRVDTDNEGETP